MKAAIETGEATPGQALPFEIDEFPETIRENAIPRFRSCNWINVSAL
ncbi:hypothetical protein [Leptolyngbya sp. FACHB-261]|nr:hypothetical protein [Leptolyngbya sp. FACHB-261]MBD2104335.1 hypothetical protein [Leptolyngbya sp. FACHB-261]